MPRTSSKPKKRVVAKKIADDVRLTDTKGESAVGEAALALFHPITARWFRAVFEGPTAPKVEGWPAIARGESTLILAPTGTGKTLTAFLWCLDKLMMRADGGAETARGCRVVYVSAAEGVGCGCGKKFAVAAGGDCEYGGAGGDSGEGAGDQRADGGYFAEGASYAVQAASWGYFD